jgi:hypothetical protein
VVFKARKHYEIPASLHRSIDAGRWHDSFNCEDNIPEPSDGSRRHGSTNATPSALVVQPRNPPYNDARSLAVGVFI